MDKAYCPGCEQEKVLVDGRLCRACNFIQRKTHTDREWDEEVKGVRKQPCDGCGFDRPCRSVTNKKTKQTLWICKPCSEDKFFLSEKAKWRNE
jgi:hypothetical protein